MSAVRKRTRRERIETAIIGSLIEITGKHDPEKIEELLVLFSSSIEDGELLIGENSLAKLSDIELERTAKEVLKAGMQLRERGFVKVAGELIGTPDLFAHTDTCLPHWAMSMNQFLGAYEAQFA